MIGKTPIRSIKFLCICLGFICLLISFLMYVYHYGEKTYSCEITEVVGTTVALRNNELVDIETIYVNCEINPDFRYIVDYVMPENELPLQIGDKVKLVYNKDGTLKQGSNIDTQIEFFTLFFGLFVILTGVFYNKD